MKRIILILALICAAPLVSNAQLQFNRPKERKTTTLTTTRLGTTELKRDHFGFYIVGWSNYHEVFQMDLGSNLKKAQTSIAELLEVFDMLEDGEYIVANTSKYTTVRIKKLDSNRLKLYPNTISGNMNMTRNEIRKFQKALAAYQE